MFVNVLKFLTKLTGLVLAPIAFGYAGYFLAFVANNDAGWYVAVFATIGFGLMMLNQMLGQFKSMSWGLTSIILMSFAGICVAWSAITTDAVFRFLSNAFVLGAGIYGLYCSFKSYEEPTPESEEEVARRNDRDVDRSDLVV